MSAVWVPPGKERGEDHIGGATTRFSFNVGSGDFQGQQRWSLFHELRYRAALSGNGCGRTLRSIHSAMNCAPALLPSPRARLETTHRIGPSPAAGSGRTGGAKNSTPVGEPLLTDNETHPPPATFSAKSKNDHGFPGSARLAELYPAATSKVRRPAHLSGPHRGNDVTLMAAARCLVPAFDGSD